MKEGAGKNGGGKKERKEKKNKGRKGGKEEWRVKKGTNEKKKPLLSGQNNREEELRRCLMGRSIASVSSILNLPEEQGLTFVPGCSCNSSIDRQPLLIELEMTTGPVSPGPPPTRKKQP